jgi:drug/metabolite transporter (DMT)-like permease
MNDPDNSKQIAVGAGAGGAVCVVLSGGTSFSYVSVSIAAALGAVAGFVAYHAVLHSPVSKDP